LAHALSRRSFINLVGSAGGATGLYATLAAMGLFQPPTLYARPPLLPASSGRDIRVVIVGAGIAGMTAGYQLRRAGYDCVILEARERAGGRVWTLRSGDRIVETDSCQQVQWDASSDLYFNAGAARISQHHQGILFYCREFGIRLEPFVVDNRAALLQNDDAFGGQPQSIRRIVADSRGAIAALAAANAPGVSKSPLGGFLAAFGGLQPDMTYTGSSRAGYATLPGAGYQNGAPLPPLPLDEIAKCATPMTMKAALFLPELWEFSPTMLQPVGGMDVIPRAFAHALGPMIRYHAEVVELRRFGGGARVIWRDGRSGRKSALDADIVICTVPLPVLKSLDADFAAPVKQAIAMGATSYIPAVKVAFQSRRWWETELQLFGGTSWTMRDITQIWYPSHGFYRKKGILVGAYIWSADPGEAFAAMAPSSRIRAAILSGERLHPGYASRVKRGVSVAWSKVPFSLGGWADSTSAAWQKAYPVLRDGDGPFYFTGEHMSYITGWQEGSVQSAHYTVQKINERAGAHRQP
jgi:monoamine oxidase